MDNTVLPALSDISSKQSKSTKQTAQKVAQILNYLATNPNAPIQYRTNGIQLAIHSDTSYLSVSNARSRAIGIHFLSKGPSNPHDIQNFIPALNGFIHVVCNILRNIMASSVEAKHGTMFANAQQVVTICTTLIDTGWSQGPTPIQFDNSTAMGITIHTLCQKFSKSTDMRFYWINNRIKQGKFMVYW